MGSALIWSGVGLALGVIAAITIVLAFSTPYWVESNADAIYITRMEKIGLWEACFNGYKFFKDSFGRTYNGCWWMFSREYDYIRSFLMPDWFVTTQALMTINVIISLTCSFLGLLVILGCFPMKARRWVVCGIALGFCTVGILMIVACVLFGTRADTDRTWLRNSTRRHLSWSFYCAVIGGLISLLASMCYAVYYLKIRKEGGHTSTAYRAREFVHYRTSERQRDRYWR